MLRIQRNPKVQFLGERLFYSMLKPFTLVATVAAILWFSGLNHFVSAQPPEAGAGTGESQTGHEGHDHGTETASDGPTSFDPAQMTEDELLKMFRSQVDEQTYKLGQEALERFKSQSEELKKVVTEMRVVHTKIRNHIIDDQPRYIELRDQSRKQIGKTYRAALDLLDFMPHASAMQFVNTMIQQRMQYGVYDAETKEGAAKLLDYNASYVHLALATARAATMTGDFVTAQRVYEKLDPEKEMEDLDRRLFATQEELKEQFQIEQALRDNDPDDLPKVRLKTTRGDILVELYINEAPSTVANFIRLVEEGFYDGLDFFQVVDHVLAITGDPLGDGSSIPEKFLQDEDKRDTVRMPLYGSLVMAKLPVPNTKDFVPNSAGTQFAILFSPLPHISHSQTIFGRVIEGFDVLGSLERMDPTKEKKKNEIAYPPDRIVEATVINRPDTLPEIKYVDPTAGRSATVPANPDLPPLNLGAPATR
ncbi:peptidylprolyl isomerase [Roseiconus lacunae]|uniref:peptidylprolyl isomerase n=1 Tax=Roseiconus lacunae TaxID=2605694 RepID=A0ABT7PD21_9BACT|nr:peptidylprolyl isomerase [Roseiconus lacunae]MDM4014373.1 peptidylprolyl isomerase [Roseiconus lacunae]